MGLLDAADAVDEFGTSRAAEVMAADEEFDLAEIDWAQVEAWWKRIGLRDGERVAFVAANPVAFAPFVASGRREE